MKRKPRAHGKIFKFVMKIFKIFKKKPVIYNLNEVPLSNQAIYLSNHSAASGPMLLSLFFPNFFIPWGAYPMTGKYLERWHYLYDVFYQKKIGYKKFKSWILSTLLAIISKRLYRGMQLIPTYPDLRLTKTLKRSMAHLNRHESILIFPEDSDYGYLEVMTRFNLGFVSLAEIYYKRYGIDLPIYPVYFHKSLNAMMIGKPIHYLEATKTSDNKEGIAALFCEAVNALGQKLIFQSQSKKNEG